MSEASHATDVKAPPCPSCGSSSVALVNYSHPACSEEIQLDLESNHGVIGCCEEYDKAPEWRCTSCDHHFGACGASDAA